MYLDLIYVFFCGIDPWPLKSVWISLLLNNSCRIWQPCFFLSVNLNNYWHPQRVHGHDHGLITNGPWKKYRTDCNKLEPTLTKLSGPIPGSRAYTFQSIGPLGRCFLQVKMSVCVSVCPSVRLSVRLSVRVSVHLSFRLSVRNSIIFRTVTDMNI